MLGIRTVVKSDLGCSAAEFVYGTTLKLPSQFVTPSHLDSNLDPSDYVHRLKRYMRDIQPQPTRPQNKQTQIHPNLETCSHVFVRCDSVRKSLQPPYNGPFRVLKRTDKYFVLDLNSKQDSVN